MDAGSLMIENRMSPSVGAVRLDGVPYLRILPQGFREEWVVEGLAFPTYTSLMRVYGTNQRLSTAEQSYLALMRGHAGQLDGLPRRPVGFGAEWGVVRNGVEFWVTNVEGLEGSAAWSVKSEDPAVGDGSWVLDVRAPGREVTVQGTLVAGSVRELGAAKAEVAGALAARPRTGWIVWEASDGFDKRLSVSLAGPTKIRSIGQFAAEVEMTFKGVDAGTPGAGAHVESLSTTIIETPPDGSVHNVFIPGTVPASPRISATGPLQAGAKVMLEDYVVTFNRAIPAFEMVVVEPWLRSVVTYAIINGEAQNPVPERSAVSLRSGKWPTVPTGAALIGTYAVGEGHVTVEVVGLW